MKPRWSKAWRKRRKQQLAYSRQRAAAFVAAGLRSDGKPRVGRKPCGCLFGCCLKCRPAKHDGYYTDAEVAKFWRMYNYGRSAAAVEREFGLPEKGLADILIRRGYALRPAPVRPKDPVTGCYLPVTPATAAQITAAIRRMKRISVPPELKAEWRHWPMKKRVAFIRRLRAHVKPVTARPETPFSSNVTPWEYGTPEAIAIARRMNAGTTSQNARVMIHTNSQGVIYQDRLYFWTARYSDGQSTGYLSATWSGSKVRRRHHCGRRVRWLLHHEIYEQHHGPIPRAHTVIFKDGNKNNFDPSNLALRSMADCARMNAWHQNFTGERRRQFIEVLGGKVQAAKTRKARAQTAALVRDFQSNTPSVLTTLTNRSNPHA